MTLASYPTAPKPAYSLVRDHQYKTTKTDFDFGPEHRARRWAGPKRTFNLVYKSQGFSASQRNAVYEFFQNRMGAWESFWFTDFQTRIWLNQYVGEGDDSTVTFDLPASNLSTTSEISGILTEDGNRIVAENGDVITSDSITFTYTFTLYKDTVAITDYTFGDGTGGGGRDQVTLPSALGLDSILTCDFTGTLIIKARFKEDKFKEDLFCKNYENLSVSIFEVNSTST